MERRRALAQAHDALLGAGADINAKDGDTPLTCARDRGHREVEALVRQHGVK